MYEKRRKEHTRYFATGDPNVLLENSLKKYFIKVNNNIVGGPFTKLREARNIQEISFPDGIVVDKYHNPV